MFELIFAERQMTVRAKRVLSVEDEECRPDRYFG